MYGMFFDSSHYWLIAMFHYVLVAESILPWFNYCSLRALQRKLAEVEIKHLTPGVSDEEILAAVRVRSYYIMSMINFLFFISSYQIAVQFEGFGRFFCKTHILMVFFLVLNISCQLQLTNLTFTL